jgi:hypothetical protein
MFEKLYLKKILQIVIPESVIIFILFTLGLVLNGVVLFASSICFLISILLLFKSTTRKLIRDEAFTLLDNELITTVQSVKKDTVSFKVSKLSIFHVKTLMVHNLPLINTKALKEELFNKGIVSKFHIVINFIDNNDKWQEFLDMISVHEFSVNYNRIDSFITIDIYTMKSALEEYFEMYYYNLFELVGDNNIRVSKIRKV